MIERSVPISDESSFTTTPEPDASTSTDLHTTHILTQEPEVSTVTTLQTKEPKPSTTTYIQMETTAASQPVSTNAPGMPAGLIAGISIAAIITTVYTIFGIGALIGYVLVLQMILQRNKKPNTSFSIS